MFSFKITMPFVQLVYRIWFEHARNNRKPFVWFWPQDMAFYPKVYW